MLSDSKMSRSILFHFTCLYSLLQWNWKMPISKSHSNVLIFEKQWKAMSHSNKSHGKMSDFISFPFVGLILAIKLGNFEKAIEYFIILWSKKITSDLNMSCQTVPDLVYALLFQINFGNKKFKHYWNGLIFFN